MVGEEQRAVKAETRQEDRRELEVLLELAASELAGKNRKTASDSAGQASATTGEASQS